MKRFVSVFGVPLAVSIGLIQGDGKLPLTAAPLMSEAGPSCSVTVLPGTLGQIPSPSVLVPIKPREKALRTYQLLQGSPSVSEPGDKIPHSYTVYGLRTGPGGMAFTDRNGVALPVASQPQLVFGLPTQPLLKAAPGVPVQPYYAPLPAPKK